MPCDADRLEIVGTMPAGQDAAVDLRVQGLDPAVHHLGEAGDVGDVGDRQAGVGERLRVPPVETSWTPRAVRPVAKSISPVLSETLRIARIFGVFLDTFRNGR